MLLVQVKGDQTAAYESLIAKLKESLAKNEKPERKAMAAGWKVYKSSEPMNGNTLYVHIVDPVSPGQNYLETYKLISETFPAEVQDLYGKTKDAFVPGGLGRLNLTLVSALGDAVAAGRGGSVTRGGVGETPRRPSFCGLRAGGAAQNARLAPA